MDPTSLDPKKRIRYSAAIGIALLALGIPLLASASVFTEWLRGFGEAASASSLKLNSQTIPILAPATNIDPHPTGGGDIAIVGGSALLPQGGPSGTLADITESMESAQISVYTGHRGDTLSGIAGMIDVSVNTIMWANDLKNGKIQEGQQLVVLPITGVRHTVVKGETLQSIAEKYKADGDEIAGFNNIDGASLAVGEVIIIPDGEITPRSTSPARTGGNRNVVGYYAWPMQGGVITQGLHGYNGIDIGAPSGTGILAAAAGTVIIARDSGWNGGYGKYLVIKHDNGTQTLYSHASRLYVSVGERVGKGAVIATVGSTGKSTGHHLHFEVRGAANPFAR